MKNKTKRSPESYFRKISEADRGEILRKLNEGVPQIRIAEEYAVSRERIRQINDLHGLRKGMEVRFERGAPNREAHRLLREERSARWKAKLQEIRNARRERATKLVDFWNSHPEMTGREMAQVFGLTTLSFHARLHEAKKEHGLTPNRRYKVK